ncbi:MAG: ATP-binding protein [Thermoanaerobaculia bacterium]|nr:Serine-protein kinase RsbW [Thermoanaerobaculia bacterium]MCK6685106.1 ATP-binding protein [Thermoanaerobaculia bacterium]
MEGFERRELHLSIPVAPDMEIAATAQVTALGEWLDMGRDKIDEMKMAVVEACINAFEHSHTPDRRVELDFVADEDDGRLFLQIAVLDGGRGFDPAKIPLPDLAAKLKSDRKRGWGLKIIESLMDDVKIESNDRGTRILMRKYR